MKQGKKQALFYSGQSSEDPEDKSQFRVMSILDGFFNIFSFLGSVVAQLPTSDCVLYFLASQKNYFDVIGPSLTMKNPFGTYANEDGVAIHGLPDMVPFPVFWSTDFDTSTFLNVKLVQEQKVDAGKDVVLYVQSDNLIGANATGEMEFSLELKQIVNPVRFDA